MDDVARFQHQPLGRQAEHEGLVLGLAVVVVVGGTLGVDAVVVVVAVGGARVVVVDAVVVVVVGAGADPRL